MLYSKKLILTLKHVHHKKPWCSVGYLICFPISLEEKKKNQVCDQTQYFMILTFNLEIEQFNGSKAQDLQKNYNYLSCRIFGGDLVLRKIVTL